MSSCSLWQPYCPFQIWSSPYGHQAYHQLAFGLAPHHEPALLDILANHYRTHSLTVRPHHHISCITSHTPAVYIHQDHLSRAMNIYIGVLYFLLLQASHQRTRTERTSLPLSVCPLFRGYGKRLSHISYESFPLCYA